MLHLLIFVPIRTTIDILALLYSLLLITFLSRICDGVLHNILTPQPRGVIVFNTTTTPTQY